MNNIQEIKQNASDFYRYARQDDKRAVNSLVNYYKAGKKTPTVAQIIMHDEAVKSLNKINQDTRENLQNGENISIKNILKKISKMTENVKNAEKEPSAKLNLLDFSNSYKKMYPKTIAIRNKLACSGKLQMDKVTPKANWFQKIKLVKFMK